MPILKNSLTDSLEEFKPIIPGEVSMYVCGMTVYDLCHIGHARSLVAFDVLRRWLMHCGYKVTFVRNITDIDDKIIKRAVKNGETIKNLTTRMIAEMHKDCESLNLIPPTHEPRATNYIPEMLMLVDKLTSMGKTIISEDSVRFDSTGKTDVFASTESDANFTLWKMGKNDPKEATWESNYGSGRPGWHLECSAMSHAILGDKFDIHGGGMDLKFPHHENEIAQSSTAFGCNPANYWIHNGFVTTDSTKMSKSLGNTVTLRSSIEEYGGLVVRFFALSANYESELRYTDEALVSASGALSRLQNVADDAIDVGTLPNLFVEAMNDNINTPVAIAIMHSWASEYNQSKDTAYANDLLAMLTVLGLERKHTKDATLIAEIEALVASRNKAKAIKDFAAADSIRRELLSLGVEIRDVKNETTWKFK